MSKLNVFFMIMLVSISLVFSCTTAREKYESHLAQLKEQVRASFSPKFDPIWVAREKKAPKALKELDRLVGVMDQALKALAADPPPPEMAGQYQATQTLFQECRALLFDIKAEAAKPKPNGMAAVHIYQEMTQKFLSAEPMPQS